MKKPCEDTYFLDRDLAYQTALAHNIVELDDGQIQKQFCYYDGAPFQHAPNNLVNVPAELFADYFSTHLQRLPRRIDTTSSQANTADDISQNRIHGMLSLVEIIQSKN